jgi:hypothetical protein
LRGLDTEVPNIRIFYRTHTHRDLRLFADVSDTVGGIDHDGRRKDIIQILLEIQIMAPVNWPKAVIAGLRASNQMVLAKQQNGKTIPPRG